MAARPGIRPSSVRPPLSFWACVRHVRHVRHSVIEQWLTTTTLECLASPYASRHAAAAILNALGASQPAKPGPTVGGKSRVGSEGRSGVSGRPMPEEFATGLPTTDNGPVPFFCVTSVTASPPYQAKGYDDGFRINCVHLCVTAVDYRFRAGADDVTTAKNRAIGQPGSKRAVVTFFAACRGFVFEDVAKRKSRATGRSGKRRIAVRDFAARVGFGSPSDSLSGIAITPPLSGTGPGDRRLLGAARDWPRRSDPGDGRNPQEQESQRWLSMRPDERVDSPEIRPEIPPSRQCTQCSKSLFRPDSRFRMEISGAVRHAVCWGSRPQPRRAFGALYHGSVFYMRVDCA